MVGIRPGLRHALDEHAAAHRALEVDVVALRNRSYLVARVVAEHAVELHVLVLREVEIGRRQRGKSLKRLARDWLRAEAKPHLRRAVDAVRQIVSNGKLQRDER